MSKNFYTKLLRSSAFLLLTAVALFVHGYHPYAEDSEIYLPGVLKILNPALFPHNAQFFGEHAGHSFYPNLIATSVRLAHLPVPWAAFVWQIASILLMLLAAWRLASVLFEEQRARWAAVCMMAALLTLPVAGTALYIIDQYLNPRNLAAFAAVFAVAESLERRYFAMVAWLAVAAAVHPFMSSFAIMFCAWLMILRRLQPKILGFEQLQNAPAPAMAISFVLPFGITLARPPAEYHQVALDHPAHFLLRWQWYEWLGLIGPVVVFWWLARLARRNNLHKVELVARAMVPFVLVAAVAAAVLSAPQRFEALARLQPMRCLALTYMLLVVIGGGFLGRNILQRHLWRWLMLFVPLAIGMHIAQRQLFPESAHIEWPWSQPRNPWAQAFDWVRNNTPLDSFFALDPGHMNTPGEDENGFRARAQRSRLADDVKDEGAASMFPPLAVPWAEQSQDQKKAFHESDFQFLQKKYGVNWIVVQQPGGSELNCPYQNEVVRVCHIAGS